jgi:hypothetical protein
VLGPFDLPPDWRPKARVVVTLTTMPHHVNLLNETLSSLLSQSLVPVSARAQMRGRNCA